MRLPAAVARPGDEALAEFGTLDIVSSIMRP